MGRGAIGCCTVGDELGEIGKRAGEDGPRVVDVTRGTIAGDDRGSRGGCCQGILGAVSLGNRRVIELGFLGKEDGLVEDLVVPSKRVRETDQRT